MDVRDKRVLVTGGARGLGALLGERLATRGARVILWDVDAAGLAATAERLRGRGRVETAVVDVSDRAAVEAAARATGPIHILINNAGIVSGRPLLDLDPAAVERTFRVNTLAHFWTLRAFLPEMVRADEGMVVTIASAAAICATPRLADYSASKSAAFAIDEALRLELHQRRSKVRTLVVCPYFIDTGMFAGVRTRFGALLPILRPDDVVDAIVRAIRLDKRRLIMPPLVYSTWLLRLLPVDWFDAIARFLGLDRSMDDFVGHGAPRRTPVRVADELRH